MLVTFAVEAEFTAWRKLRRFNLLDYQGLKLWRTQIGEAELTVLITGVGAQTASQAMDLMMRMADKEQHFDVCISSGLAGALCETLGVGDIVAPKELLSEIGSANAGDGRIEVNDTLRQLAVRLGAKPANCLLTTDQILGKASQKKSCASRAQSVDMESFEIVRQALAWGAKGVVIRAISDGATEDMPINFNLTLSSKNEISIGKVLLELLKNPLALPGLIRFGQQSRRAGARLAAFLEAYVMQHEGIVNLQESKGATAA
jgi:nucleoside phosphorylase